MTTSASTVLPENTLIVHVYFPDSDQLIASITVIDEGQPDLHILEECFEVSQNFESPWRQHAQVVSEDKTDVRSTMIGDIFVIDYPLDFPHDTRSCYRVSPFGWEPCKLPAMYSQVF